MFLALGITLVVSLSLSSAADVVRAASIGVDTTDDDVTVNQNCTLREAIIAANTNAAVDECPAGSGADTITLAAGTYLLTVAGTGENDGHTGDLDIAEALTIVGLGPDQTIIDASGVISDRVIEVRPFASTVVISGVTLTGGNLVPGLGGGFYSDHTDVELANVHIVSNTAGSGGGICVDSGSALLDGAQILSNTATNGAGVYARGSVTLVGTTVGGNSAAASGGGLLVSLGATILTGGRVVSNTAVSGAGAYVGGPATVLTQTGATDFESNVASGRGGGLRVSQASVTLSGARFAENEASMGGGIYVNNGSLRLDGGSVTSNSAGEGGGVYNTGSAGGIALVNSTVSGNSATTGGGGGIWIQGHSVLTYTTIASNTASAVGGGIRVQSLSYDITATGALLAHNSPDNCAGNALPSAGYNLDDGTSCGLTATGDISDTAPLLGPLTYEAERWVHPLLAGSPAIDGGFCVSGITVDQRGVARPSGATCDIGAYEFEWEGGTVHLPLVLRGF
jgi:CSLREA domain-containing protein